MNIKKIRREQPELGSAPRRISLPGWIVKEEELGLGEALERVFYRVGINSCPGG